ncbi:hypothetical protein [Sphingobium lactosutens]|uniref:hypothetical protein n=1 Tax=Sphingobium lactosutens TaxID=522773 RepID=UPI000413BFA1|nr:hypothetical protein [Sphingobium lactosutens]
MKAARWLAPLFLLTACQSMPAVNCENADRVRAAAALALRALDRVCPIQQAEALSDIH